jgi:hypothetical protein
VERAMAAIESLTAADLDLADWKPEDIRIFEDGVAKIGHDLFGIGKDVSASCRCDAFLLSNTPCLLISSYRPKEGGMSSSCSTNGRKDRDTLPSTLNTVESTVQGEHFF